MECRPIRLHSINLDARPHRVIRMCINLRLELLKAAFASTCGVTSAGNELPSGLVRGTADTWKKVLRLRASKRGFIFLARRNLRHAWSNCTVMHAL